MRNQKISLYKDSAKMWKNWIYLNEVCVYSDDSLGKKDRKEINLLVNVIMQKKNY